MSKITVAIIEDEYPAARLLKAMLEDLRPLWLVTILPGNIAESVEWFEKNEHPELLFLDIHLMDGNSFLFIERAHPKSLIIFTTAYDEYAIRAFSVNSIDYLLKPVHRERLEEAILKFERFRQVDWQEYNKMLNVEEVLESHNHVEKKYRTRFLISINGRLFSLKVNDVAYFFSENKLTYAVSFNGKRIIVDLPLNRLEQELNPDVFFRVNRQFILSVDAIKKIEPYFNNKYMVHVHPEYDGEITVSREKISLLKTWLDF